MKSIVVSIKLLSCFLIFLIGSSASCAQRIRFCDSTNKWHYPMCDWSSGPPVAYWYDVSSGCKGDTLIDSNRYTLLDGVLVREDTLTGQIYFRAGYLGLDSVEHLFFDYNFHPGDTLKIDYFGYGPVHRRYPILALDSVQMEGAYYKRWMISIPDFGMPIYWIEGIGSTWGPLFVLFPPNFERAYQLRCFSTHGRSPSCVPSTSLYTTHGLSPYGWTQPIPVDSFDNDSSCAVSYLGPAGVAGQSVEPKPAVLPNPGGLESVLAMPESFGTYRLDVFDVTGRTVVIVPPTNSRQQPIGKMTGGPGLYFYSIETTSGQRFSGRFIIR